MTQVNTGVHAPMPASMSIAPKANGKGKPAFDVAACAAGLVAAYYESNAVIVRARNAQLPALVLALANVPEPVTGTAYAKDWDAPMRKALADRGLEGRSLVTAANRMKVCTIAVTHVAKRPDLAPDADKDGNCTEVMQAYVDRVRPIIRDEMGVYEGGKPRAGGNATGSAGRAEGASKPKSGKVSTVSKEGAALLIAGTAERAQVLLQVMADDGLRSQFDKWAKYQLEEA